MQSENVNIPVPVLAQMIADKMKKEPEFGFFVTKKLAISYNLNDVVEAMFNGIPEPKFPIGSRVEVCEPDKEPLFGDSAGYRLFPLIPFSPERSFEAYFLEMDIDEILKADAHQGNAEEVIFMQKGRMQISLGGESHNAEKGQYIRFVADKPHQYKNNGEEMIQAIMIISYE